MPTVTCNPSTNRPLADHLEAKAREWDRASIRDQADGLHILAEEEARIAASFREGGSTPPVLINRPWNARFERYDDGFTLPLSTYPMHWDKLDLIPWPKRGNRNTPVTP